MSNGTVEPEGRLCHVIKVDTFDGYGFNLHAENSKPGQYIGKVDDGSPAETAGLKQGDRILEVNGISIAGDNHKQVVQKIKSLPNETKLLVVTPAENGKNIGFAAPKKTEEIEVNKTNGDEISHEMFTPKGPEITKLNLTMTAAELRAQLAAKKKTDPKKDADGFQIEIRHRQKAVIVLLYVACTRLGHLSSSQQDCSSAGTGSRKTF